MPYWKICQTSQQICLYVQIRPVYLNRGIFSWNSPGDMRIFFFHTGNKWSAKSLCLHYPRIFAKDNYLNSQADEVTYINSQKTAYWSFYLANIYALFHSNIVLSALNNMTCFKLHCYCASIIICIWWHAFCDQISFGSRQFFFRPSPSSSIFIYLFLFIFIYLFIFLSLFIFPSLSSSSALPNKKKKRK